MFCFVRRLATMVTRQVCIKHFVASCSQKSTVCLGVCPWDREYPNQSRVVGYVVVPVLFQNDSIWVKITLYFFFRGNRNFLAGVCINRRTRKMTSEIDSAVPPRCFFVRVPQESVVDVSVILHEGDLRGRELHLDQCRTNRGWGYG